MVTAPVMYVRCLKCPLRVKPAFEQKSGDEIAFLEEMKSDHIHVTAGMEFIHPDQADAELYTLFSGWAFRYKELDDGRRQILNFVLPGDLIGLQASLYDKSSYGAIALTDAELCVLPRRRLFKFFERTPEAAFQVTWLAARSEGLLDENLLTVGQRSAIEKIAALVLSLYRRAEALDLVRNGTLDFPLTQQHIADALGLSLVHTNKTLARLKKLGHFRLAEGKLTVFNARALAKLALYFERDIAPRPIL